jgi:hypothetical protein
MDADDTQILTAEHGRLAQATGKAEDDLFSANPWYEWGPYLSERAWGTVREDYSEGGDAWDSFPHDHARSRAYRWNEDGMAGISDVRHELCLALALWNGKDAILKERMFGLTGPQGNHGEDAKEYWWYREALPSHALLRWRYHYPQAEYPYERLVHHGRGLHDPELELLDTGVFDEDRYWSVEVTYAKASPTEVLARIEVENHGPDEATLDVLPTLWFRNTWAWNDGTGRPRIERDGDALAVADHALAGYRLEGAPGPGGEAPEPLFCENETNAPRIFGSEATTPFPKDGINDHVIGGAATVNPAGHGTKAALRYRLTVPAGGRAGVRLRLHRPATPGGTGTRDWSRDAFDTVVSAREADADEFYRALAPSGTTPDEMQILRQACAGLVWSKQIYPYNVRRWLDGDPGEPPPPEAHRHGRNSRWRHLDSFDILAMPDPWEYPWFAAWDSGFHAVAWAHLDPAFAKYQVVVLLREWFLHPNGALPAYEWNFDDVNPPVHVMAALRVFAIDGSRDRAFLERVFQKLLVNFTWWLNREDTDGNNVFSGGFLGLDNISPIDRSNLPAGVSLEQADGTAWMAYYALSMLVIALELAAENEVYEDMVVKFLEQFLLIARALEGQDLFDAEDGAFYDRLVRPSGERVAIKVQTIAGLIPILPAAGMPVRADQAPALAARLARLRKTWEDLGGTMVGRVRELGDHRNVLISVIAPDQLRLALREFFDEAAFLSPHGLRSLSKRHEGKPYTIEGVDGATIDYQAAESTTSMFGGNSNWRGPVWVPLNYLAIRSFVQFQRFLGDDFTVEYPTGSGQQRTFDWVAQDIADRIIAIWLPGPDGRRPVYGGTVRLQEDPVWRDNLLFFEYFNGDNGAGLGAMHQTGWTALVADLILAPPRPRVENDEDRSLRRT